MYTKLSRRYPGRFEGCHSYRVAEILLSIINSGSHDEQIGSVQYTGCYSLICGKKFDFIVYEDTQGFLTYDIFDRPDQELTEYWEQIVTELNAQEKE